MFEPTERPRVFGLPPGADFSEALIAGLLRRMVGTPPEALARVRIIVNTRRMQRHLTDRLSEGSPRLLPRIQTLEDLGAPRPASSGFRRELELARLVRAYLKAVPTGMPSSAAVDLAQSLSRLADEMIGEGVNADAIRSLDVSEHAEHWQQSLNFFNIVAPYLETTGDASPEAALRIAVEALVTKWSVAPPKAPVLIAGSTGSRGTTAALMRAVAKLPQGAVIVPGFDFTAPETAWENLTASEEDHPQHRLASLIRDLGLSAADIGLWHDTWGSGARNRLISLALRPAPVTDQWLREGPSLGDLRSATRDMALLEAPSKRDEAEGIALAMKRGHVDQIRVALVSPDRDLTRRVTAALDRWGLQPDDSAGIPLNRSPPGRFLLMSLDLLTATPGAADLIALLKHPLTASGGDRGPHLLHTRRFELWLREGRGTYDVGGSLATWRDEEPEDRNAWANWLLGCLAQALPRSGDFTLYLSRHMESAQALAKGPDISGGAGGLWDEAAGETAKVTLANLSDAATSGGYVDVATYQATILSVLEGAEVRASSGATPGLMIWGTLEARVQSADLVILGGLNDGVWPPLPDPDPWLNRNMRRQAGLLSPERRIGLSAHDFQQSVAARQVLITRAVRDGEAETVPSRWLNRLTNLLGGLPDQGGDAALREMRDRGRYWLRVAGAIANDLDPVAPANRPAPRPPAAARPRSLSVTRVQELIRDPYAIYGRYVLRLRPLNPLTGTPDAPLRGTLIHTIMERLITAWPDAPDDQHRLFLEIMEDELSRSLDAPATARHWRAGLLAVADKVLADERQRRREGTPVGIETPGEMTFPEVTFRLTGKADRLDRLNTGGLAIYDYKTGNLPTPKVVRHFDRQLELEGLIAEQRGFGETLSGPVERLGHISLSRGADTTTYGRDPAADSRFDLVRTRAEFLELMSRYLDPEQGFASRRAVETLRYTYGYDHLARYGEWDESADPVPEDVGD